MAHVLMCDAATLADQYRSETRDHAHLAREIHDAVSAHVVAARLLADTLRDRMPDGAQGGLIDDLCGELALALRDLRSFCFILDQREAEDFECGRDFRAIVEGLALRANLNFSYAFAACEEDIPVILKQTMMRILQEALVNVVRHARASEVHVRVWPQRGEIVLEIMDNGVGIAPDARPGVGLRSIERRAHAVGGRCRVQSDSGGTTVTTWLPGDAAASRGDAGRGGVA